MPRSPPPLALVPALKLEFSFQESSSGFPETPRASGTHHPTSEVPTVSKRKRELLLEPKLLIKTPRRRCRAGRFISPSALLKAFCQRI